MHTVWSLLDSTGQTDLGYSLQKELKVMRLEEIPEESSVYRKSSKGLN